MICEADDLSQKRKSATLKSLETRSIKEKKTKRIGFTRIYTPITEILEAIEHRFEQGGKKIREHNTLIIKSTKKQELK